MSTNTIGMLYVSKDMPIGIKNIYTFKSSDFYGGNIAKKNSDFSLEKSKINSGSPANQVIAIIYTVDMSNSKFLYKAKYTTGSVTVSPIIKKFHAFFESKGIVFAVGEFEEGNVKYFSFKTNEQVAESTTAQKTVKEKINEHQKLLDKACYTETTKTDGLQGVLSITTALSATVTEQSGTTEYKNMLSTKSNVKYPVYNQRSEYFSNGQMGKEYQVYNQNNTSIWIADVKNQATYFANSSVSGKQSQTNAAQNKQQVANQSNDSRTGSGANQAVTSRPKPKVVWNERQVTTNQIGAILILKDVPKVAIQSNGKLKFLSTVKKSVSQLPVLGINNAKRTVNVPGLDTKEISKMYQVGTNEFVYDLEFFINNETDFVKSYIKYEAIPDSVKAKLNTPIATNNSTATVSNIDVVTPDFQPNVYVRPVLQIKKGAALVNMGLRLTSCQASYTNQFQPSMTNAGWYIHSGGASLPTFNLNGVFLDMKSNREFDDFMSNYTQYVTAYRDGDFYSSAICTFFYRGKEYKCLIANFSFSQSDAEYMLNRFSMQLIVLREQGYKTPVTPPASSIAALQEPGGYYSNLKNMLINPITGYKGT